MKQEIQDLGEALNAIVTTDLIETREILNEGAVDDQHWMVADAEDKACDALIRHDGHPDFEAMQELEENYGYRVVPGETDSFGWLTGIIRTRKGNLVYG